VVSFPFTVLFVGTILILFDIYYPMAPILISKRKTVLVISCVCHCYKLSYYSLYCIMQYENTALRYALTMQMAKLLVEHKANPLAKDSVSILYVLSFVCLEIFVLFVIDCSLVYWVL